MTNGKYPRTPEVKQKQREATLKWYSKHPGPYPRRHGPNPTISEAIPKDYHEWTEGMWLAVERAVEENGGT